MSTNSSDVMIPGYWEDGVWTALTSIDATKSSMVYSIAISGSNVYVAGYSTNASDVPVPGYWEDGVWTALTPIDATKGSEVACIAVGQ
mgnify:FL=1